MASLSLETVESHRAFGGEQRVVAFDSEVLGCRMRCGVYLPPQHAVRAGADGRSDLPVLIFLSGLTCTEQNVITKGGAQRWCAEHGLILVAPDTSPRGEHVPDDEAYDLGQGAGFYLTATREPWREHFRMDAHILEEIPEVIAGFTASDRRGVTGHSMGGHGAIVLALRTPGFFRSVSAFAPILTPSEVPWGHKALSAYLGEDREDWAAWDATALLADARERLPILIDQGSDDPFLESQLPSQPFLTAARAAGHPVTYRQQAGYDHSYYFVSSFMADHVAHHAAVLKG